MSNWLLALVTLIYFGVAYGYYREHNPGMTLAFICYAGANFGFIWAATKCVM